MHQSQAITVLLKIPLSNYKSTDHHRRVGRHVAINNKATIVEQTINEPKVTTMNNIFHSKD